MSIDWRGNPEATHFDPVDQNFLREVGSALLLFNKNKGWTVPVHTSYGFTIEDCHRPLLKRPEWDGEGAPPVGAEVEAMLPGTGSTTYFWQKAKVVHEALPDSPTEVLVFSLETTRPSWADQFRRIRTAEQIEAEEREKAIDELAADTNWIVDRISCEAVIAAGYRKQVQP